MALGITFTRAETRAIFHFNPVAKDIDTVDAAKLEEVLLSKGSSLDAFKALFGFFITHAPALQANVAAIRGGSMPNGRQTKPQVRAA